MLLEQVTIRHPRETFVYSARVNPYRTVELAFQVPGKVSALNLKEGEHIRAGALVAVLDGSLFERKVRENRIHYRRARAELDRARPLAERGAISNRELESKLVDYELAEVELEKSKDNLSYSKLYAPFDAIVSRRLAEESAYVSPGTPVARLQDISKILFEIWVPERVLRLHQSGELLSASAYLGGDINRNFAIEFLEYATEPDAVTQSYRVVFAMDYPSDVSLTPGIAAKVTLVSARKNSRTHLAVPVRSLASNHSNDFFVWVYHPDSQTVHKRKIAVGRIEGENINVLSGLELSDWIVVAGVSHMNEGLQVRPFRAE